MIEIEYRPEQFSVTVKGHAGAGEPGQDIVCAGVSALMFAMTRRGERRFRAQTGEESGYAFVRCYPRPEDEALCHEMLCTGLTGLRAIAASYPECVRVREEDRHA